MKKIVTAKDGYFFNQTTKKLEKYELQFAEFYLDDETPTRYHCKLGGVSTTIEVKDLVLYSSENTFKGDHAIASIIPTGDIDRLIPNHKTGKTWAFVNGCAQEIGVNGIALIYDVDKGFMVASGEKYYASKWQVYRYNDYIVKDADGTERTVVSVASKMALSDKQMALLNEFKELAKRMEDAKMQLVFDADLFRVCIANMANTTEFTFDYEDLDDFTDVDEFMVHTDIKINHWGYDDTAYALFG